MIATPELLVVAIVLVYLIDSALFLHVNEAALQVRAAQLRGLSFGSPLELAGRRVYLPNPLAPFRGELRVLWQPLAAQSASALPALAPLCRALRPIALQSTLSLLLAVIAAPLCLLLHVDAGFVLCVALSWLLTLLAGIAAWLQRAQLELSAARVVGAVFVALICFPCAANLARALLIQRSLMLNTADLLAWTATADAGTRASAEAAVAQALLRLQRTVPEESAEYAALSAQCEALQHRVPEDAA